MLCQLFSTFNVIPVVPFSASITPLSSDFIRPAIYSSTLLSPPCLLPLRTHQAGLAAPGNVGKGMACPVGCQSSICKALPQRGVVPGAGVESDTTTQAVNLSNSGLGFLVAPSCPDLEVHRSMGGSLGTKSMPGWGHNGEKLGKLGVQSTPGAERLGEALWDLPAISSVGVGQGSWISASGRDCWDWGWKHQLGLGLAL